MPREPGWWYRAPGAMAAVLSPAAAVYGGRAEGRFKRAAAHVAPVPVICVGNFTAGGSGKTPFTLALVDLLIARGQRPAILSRGYGGTAHGPHWVDVATDDAALVGDEPLLLAARAPTLVCRDRAAGARAIVEADRGVSVIVMDDGLQNPSLQKTLSFALVDGARGVGNGRVIPAGPLRAPMAFQTRLVQAVVVNGDLAPGVGTWLAQAWDGPRVQARLVPRGDTAWLRGARVVAFAGIGHPGRFFASLTALGAEVIESVSYGDHTRFHRSDADRMLALAKRHEAQLVTTAKDRARLRGEPDLAGLATAVRTLDVTMTFDAAGLAQLNCLLDGVI